MKKIFATVIICGLFITALAGCKQENTANLIAKDLDTNLNKLEVAVNKLDSVENKYLANPDIYSSLSATPSNDSKYFALAFNENTSNTSTDFVKQTLIDKITDKLIQNNPNYNTQENITCKKYCDNNGNCYYTDCNGNNYCYNQNGICYDCNTIPNTCSYAGETTLKSENNDYEVTQLSIETNTQESTNTNNENTTSNLEETTDNDINTPNPKVKIFYFSQDSFAPIKLKYNPRYISQYNESTINEQIESYLSKVQKLYAMSEDSIEANTTLNNCKNNIIDCVKEIKELNDCIINGNCEPTTEQLQALNNYIIDIKTTTKRIKDCSGELTKEVNKINQSDSGSMINSVDVMSSNYMRLINHIDTRVTYHKSAIATLQQIKYLLDNAVNNNEISDAEIEEIIEKFTIVDEDKNNSIPENSETNIAENKENTNKIEGGNNDNNYIVNDTNNLSNDTYNNVNDNNIDVVDNKYTEITDAEITTNSNIDNNNIYNEEINQEENVENIDLNKPMNEPYENSDVENTSNSEESISSSNNLDNTTQQDENNTIDSSATNTQSNFEDEAINNETNSDSVVSEDEISEVEIIDDSNINEDETNEENFETETSQKKN